MFWVDLPDLTEQRRPVNETRNDFSNECTKVANLILDLTEKDVHKNSRHKRQIGMAATFDNGWVLISAFSKLSRGLFGAEDNVRSYVQQVHLLLIFS